MRKRRYEILLPVRRNDAQSPEKVIQPVFTVVQFPIARVERTEAPTIRPLTRDLALPFRGKRGSSCPCSASS